MGARAGGGPQGHRSGAVREPVAGLTIARFHHHTSRDLDPQLHTHAFIFNSAPRRDGSWGSLVSRDLYKAQKEAGAVYRAHLANDLERGGHAVDRYGTTFRLTAIPRDIERAFSKRRQAIEQAADTYGYRSPKGMEQAALRTRQAKRPAQRAALLEAWKQEARALGFDLARARLQVSRAPVRGQAVNAAARAPAAPSPAQRLASAQRLLNTIARGAQTSSALQGMKANLRQTETDRRKRQEHERDR